MTYGVKLQDLCVQKFGLHIRSIFQTFSQVNLQQIHNFSVSLRDQSSIEKKYLKKNKTFIPNIFFLFSVSILTFVQRY